MKDTYILKIKREELFSIFCIWAIFINQILIQVLNLNFFLYVIFILVVLDCLIKKDIRCEDLLLFLMLPNKYLQLLGCILFAIKVCMKDNFILKKSLLGKESLLFFSVSLLSAVINHVIWGGSLFNTLFQLLFYMYIFFMFAFAVDKKYSFSHTVLFQLFLVEVIMGLLQIVITGKVGDAVTGTLVSAHWYGVFLIAYGYWFIKGRKTRWKKNNILILLVVASMVFLADAKHIYLCFGIAIIVQIIIKHLKIKRQLLFVALGLTIGIFFLPLICEWLKNTIFSNNIYVKLYIENPNFNSKYLYIKKMIENMGIFNGLFGFGLGQFGSQICLTMAKGIIYPWQYGNTMFVIAAQPFREAITGLMSRWYVEEGIALSSMVLSYPLVSIVGLIAENGIIGVILLFNAIEKIVDKYENSILLIMMLLLFVFDTYLEIPCVSVSLIIFWGMQTKNFEKV